LSLRKAKMVLNGTLRFGVIGLRNHYPMNSWATERTCALR
jgi:hypothetical protein